MSFNKIRYSDKFFEQDQNFVFDGSVVFVDSSVGLTRNNNELYFTSPDAGTIPLSAILQRDRLQFNSNLDTVSPPILMRGGLSAFNMYPESKINDDETVLQTRLDSTDTWTDVSVGADLDETITNFLAWVDSNVSGTTQWEYRATITYDTGQDGETSILVEYVPI